MKIHASGEDYLEAVLVLQKKLGMVRSVDVARYMEVSKPSVCYAVGMPYGRVPQGHPVIVDYFYHEEIRGTENTGKRNR